ncbi:MAG: Transposase [Parcubacteria group bacterium GW2011_GWA2_43_13]|nr:MAG: Transposase [Parcubacteria group bacterium GW2011_GWA2_43_13]HAZ17011.1 IS1595 family transposase [Candidatus Jacksonbacteria bacterium]
MKYAKLSEKTIRKVLKCFCLELTAIQTAELTLLNRHTIDRYYLIFRKKIAEYQEENFKQLSGDIEIDESYFGSRHKGDKRGRSTERKIPVVGILKRNGTVYTRIIHDASRRSLLPIIEELVEKSRSNIYTDQWRSYDGLVLSGYQHHRINHSQEFANSHNHINGIESFWSYMKRKMRKHNGISRSRFELYLKEAEFRFNHREDDLYTLLTQIIFH